MSAGAAQADEAEGLPTSALWHPGPDPLPSPLCCHSPSHFSDGAFVLLVWHECPAVCVCVCVCVCVRQCQLVPPPPDAPYHPQPLPVHTRLVS